MQRPTTGDTFCQMETNSEKSALAAAAAGDFKPIKVDNWGMFLMHTCNNLFNREEFCDLELVFKDDDRRLMVHSLVVYSFSQFFRIELGKESTSETKTIEMPETLTLDVVKPVIQFMYLGRLKHANFDLLYNAAKLLGVDVIVRLIENQIHQSMARAKLAEEETARKLSLGHSPYRLSDDLPSYNQLQRSTAMFKCGSSSKEVRKENPSPSSVAQASKDNPGSSVKPISNSQGPLSNEEKGIDKPEKSLSNDKEAQSENGTVTDRDNSGILQKTASKETSCKISEGISATRSVQLAPDAVVKDPNDPKTQNDTISAANVVKPRVNPRSVPSSKYNEPVKRLMTSDVFLKHSNAQVKKSDAASSSASSGLGKGLTARVKKMIKDDPNILKTKDPIKLTMLMGGDDKRMVSITVEKLEKKEGGKKFIKITLDPTELNQTETISTRRPWKCEMCVSGGEKPLEFDSYYDCRAHHRRVHNKRFDPNSCDRCGFKFSKRLILLHHQFVKHGIRPKGKKRFPQCKKCKYVALTEDSLERHGQKHVREKSYSCNLYKGPGGKSKQIQYNINAGKNMMLLQNLRPIQNAEEENIASVDLRHQQQELQSLQSCNEEEEEEEEETDEQEEDEDSEDSTSSSSSSDDSLDEACLRAVENSQSHCGPEPSTMLPTFQQLRHSLPNNDDDEAMEMVNVLMPEGAAEIENMPPFLILSDGQLCDATSMVHANLNMECGFPQNGGGQFFYPDRCQQQQQQQFQFMSPQDLHHHHHHQEQQLLQHQHPDVYHLPHQQQQQPLNAPFGMQDCGGGIGGAFMQHNQYNSPAPLLYGSTFQIAPQMATMQQQCMQFTNESMSPM